MSQQPEQPEQALLALLQKRVRVSQRLYDSGERVALSVVGTLLQAVYRADGEPSYLVVKDNLTHSELLIVPWVSILSVEPWWS